MAYRIGSGNSSSSKAKMQGEEEEKKYDGVNEVLVAVGVAAGVAVVAWGLSKLFGGSGEKMMKAPGKNYYMPRKDFVSDPADWFRNHRY